MNVIGYVTSAVSNTSNAIVQLWPRKLSQSQLDQKISVVLAQPYIGCPNSMLLAIIDESIKSTVNLRTTNKRLWACLQAPNSSCASRFKALQLIEKLLEFGPEHYVREVRARRTVLEKFTAVRTGDKVPGIRQKAERIVSIISSKALRSEVREQARSLRARIGNNSGNEISQQTNFAAAKNPVSSSHAATTTVSNSMTSTNPTNLKDIPAGCIIDSNCSTSTPSSERPELFGGLLSLGTSEEMSCGSPRTPNYGNEVTLKTSKFSSPSAAPVAEALKDIIFDSSNPRMLGANPAVLPSPSTPAIGTARGTSHTPNFL